MSRIEEIKKAWPMQDMGTHYPDCELNHYTCAINHLIADNERLREACKKALTCASLDSSVRDLIVAALAGV